MSQNDGGMAFPVSDGSHTETGMTLRDWFAGQALAGMLSTAEAPILQRTYSIEDDIANTAYAFADAMLKARGEGND